MADESQSANIEQAPVLEILKQIKEGTIKAETLPKEMRQACVEHLWLSTGQNVATIAFVLKVSDKTIRRDQDEIRDRRAQLPSNEYNLRLKGELTAKAAAAHEYMFRVANEPNASAQEKAQAAFYMWKMLKEEIELAQSLGFLPKDAFKVESTVRQENEKTPAQLKEELARLEKIATDGGSINDPEVVKLIEDIRRNIALGEAKQGLARLEEKITELNNAKESSGGQ
jgi:hypothetical protein